MTATISVRGLHKVYRVYAHPRDMLIEALAGGRRHREFLALDDISFDVGNGEVVGLMGRNGAGKSTLLRIVAGTLDASGGAVETHGRIAAILELGTGFHPDYTGRENVYLGGLCLGLTRTELDRRFDEIVAFSELEAFIDQPFRTYSSGMKARLTFSVATCVDPQILIIDEALSVGDARFQLKSFDRLREFKRRGKSILVVSHSINHIIAICDRAILLEHGRVLADGDPNKVGKIYHELLFGQQDSAPAAAPPESGVMIEDEEAVACGAESPSGQIDPSSTDQPAVDVAADEVSALMESSGPKRYDQGSSQAHDYGDGRATITNVLIEDQAGQRVSFVEAGKSYRIIIDVVANVDLPSVCVGFIIRSAWGLDLYGTDTRYVPCPGLPDRMVAGERLRVAVAATLDLAPGTYFVTAAVAALDETKHHVRFDCLEFRVAMTKITMFTTSLLDIRPCMSAVVASPRLRRSNTS